MRARTRTHARTHARARAHTHAHARMYTHTRTHAHTHAHTHTLTSIHTNQVDIELLAGPSEAMMHALNLLLVFLQLAPCPHPPLPPTDAGALVSRKNQTRAARPDAGQTGPPAAGAGAPARHRGVGDADAPPDGTELNRFSLGTGVPLADVRALVRDALEPLRCRLLLRIDETYIHV